jgi:hypothetical protein
MGLAALMNLLRGRRGPAFERRGMPSPFRPMLTIMALVGAFIGLVVLLTVVSAIAALGGGGGLVVCGVPLLFIAVVAWMVSQRSKQQQPAADSDPWTIEGTATEVRDAAPASDPMNAMRAPNAAPAAPPAPQRMAPRRAEARPKPVPAAPPCSPAEYRQRAASYCRKMQSLIKSRRPGPLAERMSGVLQKLKSWEERVGQLADRLNLYERDELIQRDVRETPQHIERLRRQLALEADPEMQRQVRRTLAAYEEQQRQLELLARVMKRTRLNLDDTLAAMGTVYSQLQVLNAMDIDGPTATRIADDVDREIVRLNDMLAAMSDVYSQASDTYPQASSTESADGDAGLAGRKARLGGSAAN